PMPEPNRRNPVGIALGLVLLMIAIGALLEGASRSLLAEQERRGGRLPHAYTPLTRPLNAYLQARYFVLDHFILVSLAGTLGLARFLVALKRLAAARQRMRARASGMDFDHDSNEIERVPFDLLDRIQANPKPDDQVFLGLDAAESPVYL